MIFIDNLLRQIGKGIAENMETIIKCIIVLLILAVVCSLIIAILNVFIGFKKLNKNIKNMKENKRR
jgi:uncharacterized membrane protein (DUF106 family)